MAVTVVACVLAAAVGRGTAGTAAVGAAVLTGQLSVGWSNDWWDAARDAAVGRADKPTVSGSVTARTLGVAAALAAGACVPLSLLSGPPAAATHLVAVGSAWLYNRPLKRTVLSLLPYLVSFGLLPAFVVLGLPGHPLPPWWLCAAGALLGSGAHFFNTLPDLAADRATGVRGLPHRLGARGAWMAGAVLLLAASAVLAFAPTGSYRIAGLAVSATVLGVGVLLGRRAAFRTALVVAVLQVALLITAGTSIR